MKPNFALSLSFQGLSLLQRVDGGWKLIGEVDLDDPHLTARLEEMRETALALAPDNAEAGSNLLLTLHYRDDVPAEALARAHHDWAATHAGPASSPPVSR